MIQISIVVTGILVKDFEVITQKFDRDRIVIEIRERACCKTTKGWGWRDRIVIEIPIL